MKRVLVNKTITEKQHKRHAIFIPWFDQAILAYFHVMASQWTRVALNPFLHKLEPLALTILITKKAQSKDGRATHARLKSAAQPHTQVKK
jgi:hypothetical protein